MPIHLILLSGGSGSRLWPLSNSARSKQFLKVLRDDNGDPQSMVQRVFEQVNRVAGDIDITIATCANQESSIRSQLNGGYSLVLEPERRDTAPAIMLASAFLAYEKNANPADPIVVMPIDSYADQSYYDKIVDLAEAASCHGGVALLGVRPTYPSEKYGYIIPDCELESGGTLRVREFKEKPAEELAKRYIEMGALWNCGVFAFQLQFALTIISNYIQSTCYSYIKDHYSRFPKNSFDYEILEKTDDICVLPYQGKWKDLGTWNTLTEEMKHPMQGRVVAANTNNVHVINETGLPMVVSGLNDAVVVATHDGILACSKSASTGIKQLVDEISESRPMYEKRRWGEYRVLDSRAYDNGRHALTKELVIAPGKQLSYQRHVHRSEVWTITSGKGEVVIDGKTRSVKAGTVIDIQPLQLHAIRATNELHIIEVQLGYPLIEEDIERFGNYWKAEE